MSFVSVQEAALLIGKSAPTIYRHIKIGKLSRSSNGKIDTAELLRVYGKLIKNDNQNETPILQVDNENEKWLKSQILSLQQDIKDLKAESMARENRLMALLESKGDKADAPPPKSFLGKLFN